MTSARADAFCTRVRWQDLDPAALLRLVARAKAEDLEGYGFLRHPPYREDVTSRLLDEELQVQARLVARMPMVVCGLGVIKPVLQTYGSAFFEAMVEEGAKIDAGTVIGILRGPVQVVLPAERVLLNFLQHLSGIATLTHRYVSALGDSPIRLLDTRKTIPGYRALHKYAVATGGGWNHRLGLYDRVMLKDNHLAAHKNTPGNGLAESVRRARAAYPELPVQAEVDTIGQIPALLAAGVDILLLDNFGNDSLRAALELIDGRAATEASGGITLERLESLRTLPLDFVSTGATVHQSVWVDIGLDLD